MYKNLTKIHLILKIILALKTQGYYDIMTNTAVTNNNALLALIIHKHKN